MKQWLRTLLQMTTWKDDPSAPELARELKRDQSNVRRELKMMQAHGFVKRIEAYEKNPKALNFFSASTVVPRVSNSDGGLQKHI